MCKSEGKSEAIMLISTDFVLSSTLVRVMVLPRFRWTRLSYRSLGDRGPPISATVLRNT